MKHDEVKKDITSVADLTLAAFSTSLGLVEGERIAGRRREKAITESAADSNSSIPSGVEGT